MINNFEIFFLFFLPEHFNLKLNIFFFILHVAEIGFEFGFLLIKIILTLTESLQPYLGPR